MKFKIGDKVKVINCDNAGTDCANFNKVSTITDIMNGSKYPYELKGITEYFREKELELVERQFTKSDLKDGDLITYRNGDKAIKLKGEIQDLISKTEGFLYLSDVTEELNVQAQKNGELDIIKVERPVKYETVYERAEEEKKEILDKVEKNYLINVIKPFRKRVKFIRKIESLTFSAEKELLQIQLNDDDIALPYFEKNTMYKGMKLDKDYSLEELGI